MSRDDEDEVRRLYHSGGHDTEEAAAESIMEHLGMLQGRVLQLALERHRKHLPGFMQWELSEWAGTPKTSTYRTRVSELVRMDLIEDSGERGENPETGRSCIIWRLKMPSSPAAAAAAPSTPSTPPRSTPAQSDLFG